MFHFFNSTHSSRINRRSLLMFGTLTFGLILFQTGWQVTSTIQDGFFPDIWPFRSDILHQSSTWFYALIQVILSTQIGVGAIPVMSGKFLYKGDAIRTCAIYMCFNFLVSILATAYFMTTFGQHNSSSSTPLYADLTTVTSIYDRAFVEEEHSYFRSLIPSLAYLMVILAGLISVSIAIYTSSRLFKRHPNYIMCLVGMFIAIASLICPHFLISRMLDLRWVGIVIVCALVFDIVSIAWIYGSKNLSIDLEFSIGRPIMKIWLVLWTITPIVLIGIISWWIALPSSHQYEPIDELIPRWIPIVVCVIIIVLFSGHEVSKQVDYNTCNMIHESTKPAKDWGPADPLVRHAWKQWKSVCDDTGQRDFTLRRRGTKDWTSSIKKGQYSHASRNQSNSISKYNVNGKQASSSMTGGSNSPNYSGSVFGDSAIEEDMNSDKYRPTSQSEAYANHHHEPRSRKSSTKRSSDAYLYHQQRLEHDQLDDTSTVHMESNYHSQKIPIRIPSFGRRQDYTSRIEIFPPESPSQFQVQPVQSTFLTKNPLSHHIHDVNFPDPFNDKFGHHMFHQDYRNQQTSSRHSGGGHLINNIHIGDCSEENGSMSTKTTNTGPTYHDPYGQRKMSRNAHEFSTEL